ncbi:MAG: 28S ribosomal protein S2, mitochondrial [Marteilia pararefringens]
MHEELRNSLRISRTQDRGCITKFQVLSSSSSSSSGSTLRAMKPQQVARIAASNHIGLVRSIVQRNLPSIGQLFLHKVHLGHKSALRHVDSAQFLFGTRPNDSHADLGRNLDIIDLKQTRLLLENSLLFLTDLVLREGIILFASYDRKSVNIIEEAAERCDEFAHCHHFSQSLFTAFFTDKGLGKNQCTKLPDTIILINTWGNRLERHPVIKSAAKLLIPTIAIVDSNCSTKYITYPVPGNDDSEDSIRLFVNLFSNVIIEAKNCRGRNIESIDELYRNEDEKENK